MGDDIGLSCVCLDFCRGAALHCWVCPLRLENDLKRQSVTEPESMSSPINYPAYLYGIHKNFHTALYIEIEEIGRENNFRKDLKKLNLVYFGQATK